MSKNAFFAKSSRSQWVNKANLIFCLTFHIYLTSGEFHCPGDVAVCRSKVLARPWVGVRVCHFLLLLISKTHETHRFNQGTSVGKPKQNGEVYPAKALLLEKMSRERQRKRELWHWNVYTGCVEEKGFLFKCIYWFVCCVSQWKVKIPGEVLTLTNFG